MDYLNRKEPLINKKEMQDINNKLAKQLEYEDKQNIQPYYKNFYTTQKPKILKESRVNKLDKNIDNHIIVCGIVKGIKNLFLPLRSKFQSGPKRPIVILSNDSLGDENLNGDTFIWSEINIFDDIYLIKGTALSAADLVRARVGKA